MWFKTEKKKTIIYLIKNCNFLLSFSLRLCISLSSLSSHCGPPPRRHPHPHLCLSLPSHSITTSSIFLSLSSPSCCRRHKQIYHWCYRYGYRKQETKRLEEVSCIGNREIARSILKLTNNFHVQGASYIKGLRKKSGIGRN